jgi:antitoxin VapB
MDIMSTLRRLLSSRIGLSSFMWSLLRRHCLREFSGWANRVAIILGMRSDGSRKMLWPKFNPTKWRWLEVDMSKEYRAKVFKSGNSVALRLPKELGLKDGSTMILREERSEFIFKPEDQKEKKIDLTGIYGSIPGLERQPFEHKEREWSDARAKRG